MTQNRARMRGKPFRKPTHGSCCTFQVCGYDYDACICGITEDISAAFELVAEVQAKPDECFFGLSHTPVIPHEGKPCWHVELGGVLGYGSTAPLAICRAWLKYKKRKEKIP